MTTVSVFLNEKKNNLAHYSIIKIYIFGLLNRELMINYLYDVEIRISNR